MFFDYVFNDCIKFTFLTQIPTNKPVQRDDKSDLIYISQKGKFDAVVEDVSNLPF
jgi:preprotein translocase subunit SecA